jgi:hypothetical protein
MAQYYYEIIYNVTMFLEKYNIEELSIEFEDAISDGTYDITTKLTIF